VSKATGLQAAFNGGELSPSIAGRVDVAKYANGCERMENFLPTVQGPAVARPGFPFVAEVKDSAVRAWLLRFEFSVAEAYQLEFGDGYIRFFASRAQAIVSGVAAYNGATAYVVGDLVLQGGINYYCIAATTGNAPPNATYWYALTGVIYEIPSPYAVADLTNADGSLALRFAQTGDEVYLVHASYPPYVLSRYAATRWTIEALECSPPPFKALNTTTTTIYASAATGTGVTLTASAATFTAAMVGQYIYLAEKDVRDTKLWEAAKAIIIGDVRRSDGKNYEALNAATTGGTKPTHSSGAAYDGDTGVQWQFNDAGYGWAKITAFGTSTSVTADVVSRLPAGAVLVANATTRWALQAWSAADGYPTAVTFFRERLVFARNSTIWFSVSADFPNFAAEVDGLITADSGFERTLSSDRANNIRWLSPGTVLLVGTAGDEWAIVENSASDAFGPANCRAKPQSSYGSSYVAPVRVADVTLFMQKAGRKMRAMAFRYEEDGFKSDDTTVYAAHITRAGIVDMAYQQEPQGIVWAARADGVLVAMTFNREQDVVAWHRHPLAGGFVECVETIPAPDGSQDDLWVIVRYTINGVTKRYVAYLNDIDEEGDKTAQEDWIFSDMALTYDGAPATAISGLGHLEGEEVWVLADGAVHPNRTVSAGAITLQAAASKVQVGLPCPGYLETMQLNMGGDDGTAQGKIKRVHQVVVRVLNSLRGRAGPSEGKAVYLQGRLPSVPMGSAPPPFTGDIPLDWPGDYDRKQTVLVVKDAPMPQIVVAVIPSVQTNTR
jgi:hypothetical protein